MASRAIAILVAAAALARCSALSLGLDAKEEAVLVRRHALRAWGESSPALSPASSPASAYAKTQASERRRDCEDAAQGGACYSAVMWLKNGGFEKHKDWYEGYHSGTPFEDVQLLLSREGKAKCKTPCSRLGKAEESKHVDDTYGEVVEVGDSGRQVFSVGHELAKPEDLGCQDAVVGDWCHNSIRWLHTKGLQQHPDWYPNLEVNSSSGEIQAELYRMSKSGCRKPCTVKKSHEVHIHKASVKKSTGNRTLCHTATSGSKCYRAVMYGLMEGITQHPDMYKELPENATFADVQMSLSKDSRHGCQRPCFHGRATVFSYKKKVEDMTMEELNRFMKGEWDGMVTPPQPADDEEQQNDEEEVFGSEDQEANPEVLRTPEIPEGVQITDGMQISDGIFAHDLEPEKPKAAEAAPPEPQALVATTTEEAKQPTPITVNATEEVQRSWNASEELLKEPNATEEEEQEAEATKISTQNAEAAEDLEPLPPVAPEDVEAGSANREQATNSTGEAGSANREQATNGTDEAGPPEVEGALVFEPSKRAEVDEDKKAEVLSGYPESPGCFMRMPSGCPNHFMKTRMWRHDVDAEAQKLGKDPCKARKQYWDEYCGSTDVKIVYIAGPDEGVSKSADEPLPDIVEQASKSADEAGSPETAQAAETTSSPGEAVPAAAAAEKPAEEAEKKAEDAAGDNSTDLNQSSDSEVTTEAPPTPPPVVVDEELLPTVDEDAMDEADRQEALVAKNRREKAEADKVKVDKLRADLEALGGMEGTGVEQLRAEKRVQIRALEAEMAADATTTSHMETMEEMEDRIRVEVLQQRMTGTTQVPMQAAQAPVEQKPIEQATVQTTEAPAETMDEMEARIRRELATSTTQEAQAPAETAQAQEAQAPAETTQTPQAPVEQHPVEQAAVETTQAPTQEAQAPVETTQAPQAPVETDDDLHARITAKVLQEHAQVAGETSAESDARMKEMIEKELLAAEKAAAR